MCIRLAKQKRQAVAQSCRHSVREGGQQNPLALTAGAQQMPDSVQGDDRLAGAGATRDLSGSVETRVVRIPALGGVEEDAPTGEVLAEDPLQLPGARDFHHAVGRVENGFAEGHRRTILRAAHGLPPWGDQLLPDVLGRVIRCQELQHLVLVGGHHGRRHDCQIVGRDADACQAQNLVVDAEVTQHGVGVLFKEAGGGCDSLRFEVGLHLLHGIDVAHLQASGGPVDRVDPLARPVDRLVVRSDPKEREQLAAVVGGQENPR